MTIRLGDIELVSLQRVEVDEARSLVEHRIPGQQGSLFQDLGRGALGLRLEGVLLGEQALRRIEDLRSAYTEGTPLRFSADIAVGTELTDVVIAELDTQQVPGHRFRYQVRLRVREWIEPPEPPGAALAAVDTSVASDAAAWTDQAQALGGALDDPGALASLLDGSKELLARIDVAELAQAVLGALDGIDAGDLAHLVASVTGIDPEKLEGVLTQLAEADSLEDVFAVLADGGLDVIGELAGVDLSQLSTASALLRAFVGGPELISRLQDVGSRAQALIDELGAFDPFAQLRELQPEGQ